MFPASVSGSVNDPMPSTTKLIAISAVTKSSHLELLSITSNCFRGTESRLNVLRVRSAY